MPRFNCVKRTPQFSAGPHHPPGDRTILQGTPPSTGGPHYMPRFNGFNLAYAGSCRCKFSGPARKPVHPWWSGARIWENLRNSGNATKGRDPLFQLSSKSLDNAIEKTYEHDLAPDQTILRLIRRVRWCKFFDPARRRMTY